MSKSRQTNGLTALYKRLSDEDWLLGSSNSIVNQRAILEEHAKKNVFPIPNKLVMDDVEAGKVSIVITKDAYVKLLHRIFERLCKITGMAMRVSHHGMFVIFSRLSKNSIAFMK